MTDELAELKDKIERYRRLMIGTDDTRTKAAVKTLIAELETQVEESERNAASNPKPDGAAKA